MCAIIDTCCWPLVFGSKSTANFVPIRKWIDSKNGRIIGGGTKYKREISPMDSVIRLLAEYERSGKVIRLNDASVDAFAKAAKQLVPTSKFNDEHLVGMVIASKCRVVCTVDNEAMPFLKKADLYAAAGVKPPKIYNKGKHRRLCCSNSIAPICKGKS